VVLPECKDTVTQILGTFGDLGKLFHIWETIRWSYSVENYWDLLVSSTFSTQAM